MRLVCGQFIISDGHVSHEGDGLPGCGRAIGASGSPVGAAGGARHVCFGSAAVGDVDALLGETGHERMKTTGREEM